MNRELLNHWEKHILSRILHSPILCCLQHAMDQLPYAPAQNPIWKIQGLSTLRNVDKRPGTHFVGANTHSGLFTSLKVLVHLIDTHDNGTWPPPIFSQNIRTTDVGNPGLTYEEEGAIALFPGTLSKGSIPQAPWSWRYRFSSLQRSSWHERLCRAAGATSSAALAVPLTRR